MGNLTPELIEALSKAAVSVIAAFGAIIAVVASVITAYLNYKTRQDTHYLGDKIRSITGEPLQYRYDKSKRAEALAATTEPSDAKETPP